MIVETARSIIDEEFATLYGVQEVADRLEITVSHLIREFTKQIGISPGKYLCLCRIENSKRLLSSTDLPVMLVAAACGFAESGYFCRVFKKETGLTPTQYRVSHAGSKVYVSDVSPLDSMYL